MLLNHFSDPFQNGLASVDAFFGESNRLTEQSNGINDNNVGYGFSQNPAGYEWGGDGPNDAHAQQGGDQHHAGEFRGTGGYHGQNVPMETCGSGGGGCGKDPQALHRANLKWEKGAEGFVHNNGKKEAEPEPEPIIYSGPDDLDYDDEEVAPQKGMPFWQKRMPTIIIHGITILVWIWLWSSFGFNKILVGTPGHIVYWGFIALMGFGVMQSDHRAALYKEERELQRSVESVLKLVVKMVAVIATILLSFEVLKKRGKGDQHAIYSALGLSFFIALGGLVSFSSCKRGETIRRYRKVKSAALNLSIGLIAVAAMLSFGFGVNGGLGSSSFETRQKGGADSSMMQPEVETISMPAKKIIVETAPTEVIYQSAPVDPGLRAMAPQQPGYEMPQQYSQAPTIYDQQMTAQPSYQQPSISPTLPQQPGATNYPAYHY